jgi:putative ABC transport system permease protein
MSLLALIQRNVLHYWRTNLAVVAGVAVAVAVLAGALLVGASVRSSLRALALERLGAVDRVVTSARFVPEAFAAGVLAANALDGQFTTAAPLVAVEGFVTHQASGRRASGVQVYGVDERFWTFHGLDPEPFALGRNAALVSGGLAGELDAAPDDALLVRVEKPSAVPLSSLHGRRDDVGRTLRLGIGRVLEAAELGEFSFRPQQGLARSVFVPLARLQGELEQEGRVNTLLLGHDSGGGSGDGGLGAAEEAARQAAAEAAVRGEATLESLGLRVRAIPDHDTVAVESAAGLLTDETVAAVEQVASGLGLRAEPVLSYLANQIRSGDRITPYSVVAARDLSAVSDVNVRDDPGEPTPVILNQWTADDLGAAPGDPLTIEYYLWADEGRLTTHEAEMRVAGVVPIAGAADDPDLTPDYPGITEATNVIDWDPPFPVNLELIRPADETYWDDHRTTPKAFIPLAAGQRLWASRWGQVTSVRLFAPPGEGLDAARDRFAAALREALDPLSLGFVVYPARSLALEASAGVTDFGEYFTYFSFFLVVSALLLASLFFRLGVEQRLREIGALRALGFDERGVRGLFWAEAAALSLAGGLLGAAGAVGYAELIMWGLRTWWVDAVGTTLLVLHVSPLALAAGIVGGMLAALVSIAWSLRMVARATPRALIHGVLPSGPRAARGAEDARPSRAAAAVRHAPAALGLLGGAVLAATLAGIVGDTAGFFGAGMLLLAALLALAWTWLGRQAPAGVAVPSTWTVSRVGLRNTTARPGRSVLCITLIAFASFIIVAVDAFHLEGGGDTADRSSGTGGYPLLAESLLPIVRDLASEESREELGVSSFDDEIFAGVSYARFRLRPGEDTSCLNLYQAKDPRVLAPETAFLSEGRFRFGATLAETPEEAANPWLLLDRVFDDGAIPAIADATSLAYALHLSVGEDFVLNRDTDNPIRLRIVAALTDSLFQRELIVGEAAFVRLFPGHDGYRFFLIDAPADGNAAVTAALEDRLADYGFDVTSAPERLAAFHRVNNTYLATFQTLGALGLLLGTLGLGAVLLRNVLERRRELALLRAVGYNTRHVSLMVLVENGLLLFGGLGIGTVCALVAIAPAWIERGGQFPVVSLGGMLLAVAAAGLVSSLAATAAAVRSPLLASLRSE